MGKGIQAMSNDKKSSTVDQFKYVIKWRGHDGSTSTLRVEGTDCTFEECNEAIKDLARQAYAMGYTKPRWWQFWRSGDSVVDHPDK